LDRTIRRSQVEATITLSETLKPQAPQAGDRHWRGVGRLSGLSRVEGVHVAVRPDWIDFMVTGRAERPAELSVLKLTIF
jgi:hypothetical protein